MEVARKVAIVTGGGGGIGSALAERLAAEGAKVVVTDLDGTGPESIVRRINAEHRGAALALQADASDDAQIASVIDVAERTFGPVDLYFANAGVAAGDELEPDETVWDLAFDVNVRAHIRATRRLIPGWIERGEGYFVSTASAAGLLTQIGPPRIR